MKQLRKIETNIWKIKTQNKNYKLSEQELEKRNRDNDLINKLKHALEALTVAEILELTGNKDNNLYSDLEDYAERRLDFYLDDSEDKVFNNNPQDEKTKSIIDSVRKVSYIQDSQIPPAKRQFTKLSGISNSQLALYDDFDEISKFNDIVNYILIGYNQKKSKPKVRAKVNKKIYTRKKLVNQEEYS